MEWEFYVDYFSKIIYFLREAIRGTIIQMCARVCFGCLSESQAVDKYGPLFLASFNRYDTLAILYSHASCF
jgi:hypothetical protein